MRILVAEDDLQIAKMLTLTLEKLGGHNVTLVHNGEMALHMALSADYDVILLDEQMPVKTGQKVAQEYKAKKNGKGSPIIFLSARTDTESVNKFLTLGAGYIQKPFLPTTLCDQIQQILKSRKEVSA